MHIVDLGVGFFISIKYSVSNVYINNTIDNYYFPKRLLIK